MAEYINLDTPLEMYRLRGNQREPISTTLRELLDFNKIPYTAADVAPVRHGRWLTKEYMYGDPDVGIEDAWVDRLAEATDYYAYCSNCGKDAEYTSEGELVLSDYCPNCWAKMEAER